jgi:hypothetical protein
MAVVGGYRLDLYCDYGGEPFGDNCPSRRPSNSSVQGEYHGDNERHCLKLARLDGWTFRENATIAYCPGCSNLRRKH